MWAIAHMEAALVDLGFGALLEKIEEHFGRTVLRILLAMVLLTLGGLLQRQALLLLL